MYAQNTLFNIVTAVLQKFNGPSTFKKGISTILVIFKKLKLLAMNTILHSILHAATHAVNSGLC